MILTTPLLSIQSVPRIVKIALTGLIAFLVFPSIYHSAWELEIFTLEYLLLLIGESIIGIITGFFVNILFASFSSAGQFFSYQMGFGASEVYDALAQIENLLQCLFFYKLKDFNLCF